MGESGRYDVRHEDMVMIECDDCSDDTAVVGRIEMNAEMKYEFDEDDEANWAMSQDCKMLPANDNNFSGCERNWRNYDSDLVQNWSRSDLTSLENAEYSPTTDKTSEVHATFSASVGGIGVSVGVDHPEQRRDMTYTYDEEIRGEYNQFTYDAAWKDTQIGHVSAWYSDRPSNGYDDIAPSYFHGGFIGDDCNGNSGEVASSDVFEMFEWHEF